MKITKSQLRKIIKEEVLNEIGGVYGGRAENAGDPYAAARQSRSWDKKNKAYRDREGAAAKAREVKVDDLESIVNVEMKKVFPDLNMRNIRNIHANTPSAVLGFIEDMVGNTGGMADPAKIAKGAADFFAGKRKSSPYSDSDKWLSMMRRYQDRYDAEK